MVARQPHPHQEVVAWSVAAILLGLLVALPITLYLQYNHGSAAFNAWADDYVPKFPFNNAVGVKQVLTAQGSLEDAGQYTGWRRWIELRPTAACVWSFAAGLAAVTLFAAARLRFPCWPLHPLLFVTCVALEARDHVTAPAATRTPVSYRPDFLGKYEPNVTAYIPDALRNDLMDMGRVPGGDLPAGTYLRQVMDRLLVTSSCGHISARVQDTVRSCRPSASRTRSDSNTAMR